MNCIVIDDEPMALELLQEYIRKTDSLTLAASFTNPFKALNYLINNQVELLFLDINMPELSGIQLINSLSYKPKVIFTTAYSEYGAESYEYNAVDYLLKPFKYDRFMRAVNKLNTKVALNQSLTPTALQKDNKEYIFLKSGTKTHKIELNQILFIEAQGNYIKVHTIIKTITCYFSLNEIMNQILPDSDFIRIHKSFIVGVKHIDTIEKHQVVINNVTIPIGTTYRELFHTRVSSLRFG